MSSQPQLYRTYFEKRYGLAVSDGSISSRVSIEIARLERSLGANVVKILDHLNGKPISCDAYVTIKTHSLLWTLTKFQHRYDLHTLGSKRDVILGTAQTAKGSGFGLPYGKTRIWQWTAYWVTHLVNPKFEVPYILPSGTVFIEKRKV